MTDSRPPLSAMTDKALLEATRELQVMRSEVRARRGRIEQRKLELETEERAVDRDLSWIDWFIENIALQREANDA